MYLPDQVIYDLEKQKLTTNDCKKSTHLVYENDDLFLGDMKEAKRLLKAGKISPKFHSVEERDLYFNWWLDANRSGSLLQWAKRNNHEATIRMVERWKEEESPLHPLNIQFCKIY